MVTSNILSSVSKVGEKKMSIMSIVSTPNREGDSESEIDASKIEYGKSMRKTFEKDLEKARIKKEFEVACFDSIKRVQ